jgi:hypothetical protein
MMFKTVNVLGLKVDVLVVDVFKVDALEVDQIRQPAKIGSVSRVRIQGQT